MYELINTSVPNGLIAGTHGFATVAMTKGMPDAIRTRLESFCAYPHRTGAHDQSYFAQNPVNWFHLTLPTGDHVVGRTAPAEFDYTGRTNRLAHLLQFTKAEMPACGGAFVLNAEAADLGEPWRGEPRLLPMDKTRATRLRQAASNFSEGVSPTTWIEMFGSQGTQYAKRFALLLAQNLCRSGKSLYFKAGAADTDGRRLLGLFADLINLLPVEFAAQATFSTFSPCVPTGTTCHLRGVFDRDRAFDAASTLQPWVDCETGTIQHEELLPSLETETAASAAMRGSETPAPLLRSAARTPVTLPVTRGGTKQPYRPLPYAQQKESGPKLNWLIGSLVGTIFVLAVAVMVCWFLKEEKSNAERRMQIEKEFGPTNDGVATSESSPLKKVSGSGDTDKTDPTAAEIEAANRRADEQAKKEAAAREAKERARKAQEEQRIQHEKAKRKTAEADAAKRAEFKKPLADLTITEVVDFGSKKSWLEKLKTTEKDALTNENALVFSAPSANAGAKSCVRWTGSLQRHEGKKDFVTRKKSSDTYTVVDATPGTARDDLWRVVYSPTLKRVYWEWRRNVEVPRNFFEQSDTLDPVAAVFGGFNDGEAFFRKWAKGRFFYVLGFRPSRNVAGYQHIYSATKPISIERYKDLCQKDKAAQDALAKLQKELAEHQAKLNALSTFTEKMWKICEDFKQKQEELKSADDKKTKRDEVERQCHQKGLEAYVLAEKCGGLFTNVTSLVWRTLKGKPVSPYFDLKTFLDRYPNKEKLDVYVQSQRKKIEDDIQKLNGQIEEKKKAAGDWKDVVRGCGFTVKVFTQDEVLRFLDGKKKSVTSEKMKIDALRSDIGQGKDVDCIVQESGVDGR